MKSAKRLQKQTAVKPKNNTGDCQVTLVGVDEVNLEQQRISWKSPIAQALLGRCVGEETKVHSPEGNRILKIISVSYI